MQVIIKPMDAKSPKLEAVFEPLDKESYRRRCENVVPSIYLTFISIIEGIALGLLAQQLFSLPTDGSDRIVQFWARAPYALSTFM